jgi:hypothetical protein
MLNVRNCCGMVVLGTMLALPAMAQTQAQPAPAKAAVDPAATPAAPQSDEALARQLSNPVASLVSVPFQFNWDQPVGPDDETRFVLNVQPVIPLSLNDDWNLILRWIMPYIGQPPLFEGGVPTQGMGDIVASMFFSPAKPGRFIWGAGPVFMLPTNASPVLGTSRWSVGPSFVILKQSGQWTFGMLANHLWSFAGNDVSGGVERGQVNASFLQPFASYTTKSSVTMGVSVEASGNWRLYNPGPGGSLEQVDGTQWTVPIMFTASKLTRFGPFPMSIGGGVGWFAVAPDGGPSWRLRMVGTILLPRR